MKNLSPMLKSGIRPVLPEFGKIKIGAKSEKLLQKKDGSGTWQPPEKHDYFTITTLERGKDNNFLKDENIHKIIGSDKPTRIPIRLLYNDPAMNFQSRFVCYKGKSVQCMGDGEKAFTSDNQEITCPCEKSEPGYTGTDVCKMNGVLSCIIEGTEKLGGVYKFRTTSFNAIQGLTSALAFIFWQTKGILAGIPLELVISKKDGANPKTGEPVKVIFVTLEYKGNIQRLLDEAIEVRKIDSTYETKIKQLTGEILEDELKKELSEPEEFYPEPADEIDLGESIPEPEPEPEIKETKKRTKKSDPEPELKAPETYNEPDDSEELF